MSVSQEEVSIWNSTFHSVLKSIFFFNFVVPAGLTNLNVIDFYFLPTGLPSKRCQGIGFLSRADWEIGVVRHVAQPTGSSRISSGGRPHPELCRESREPLPEYAGDPSSIPWSRSSPEEGIGYPLLNSWASLVAQTTLQVKNAPEQLGISTQHGTR